MSAEYNVRRRSLNVILGDRLNLDDFFFPSTDDPDDWSDAFMRAGAEAHLRGGKEIQINGRPDAYKVKKPIEFAASWRNVHFRGEGDGTKIERAATMTTGKGLFDIKSQKCSLCSMHIDGGVTSPVGLRYGMEGAGGDFDNDPYLPILTTNSSLWLHAGNKEIQICEVTIHHTGGYAALVDAEDGDIDGVLFDRIVCEQNRPHLFGLDADLNYGSWTSGILYRGHCLSSEGKLGVVKNLRIKNSKFRRATGNQIWGHSYGFDSHHQDIHITDCDFEDIGLDGVLMGNVDRGSVTGCSFLRIGYITRTDTDTPDPQALLAKYAVALDTSGYARNCRYVGNNFRSINGGFIDADGLRESTIAGNIHEGTIEGSPESNIIVGINLGNTQNNGGGEEITIANNTISHCAQAGIRLNNPVNVNCEGNVVDHPATATEAPIQIWSDQNKARGVKIHGNTILFADPGRYCIVESGTLDGTCQSQVFDNQCSGGNLGEFAKAANTKSFAGAVTALLVLKTQADLDPAANSFDGTHLLFRRTAAGKAEYSEDVSSGARIWKPFGGSVIESPFVLPKQNNIFDGGELAFESAGPTWPEARIDLYADVLRIFSTNADNYQQVDVWGRPGTWGLKIQNGWVDSGGGFLCTASNLDSLNLPNGGATCKFFVCTLSSNFGGASAAAAGLSNSGQAREYFDSSDQLLKLSENGGAYRMFAMLSAGAAADRIAYFTGVNGLGSSSNFVYKAGNLGINEANPAHRLHVGGAIFATGAIQSGASGSAIGLQINGGQFQADGSGNVSGAGQANFVTGYIGGSFRGAGVATQAEGIGGGAFSLWDVSSYEAIVFRSGGVSIVQAAKLRQGSVDLDTIVADAIAAHVALYH